MNPLYHYCTVETFKCILSNKTIRLSDIRKSNDPKEIEFLFEMYQKWNLKKNNYSENANHNNIVLNTNKIIQLENETFLVLCFSKIDDSLEMWNRYACKGVAIEFDENELTDYLHFIKMGIPENLIETCTSSADVLIIKPLEYYNQDEINTNYFDKKDLNGYDDFTKILDDAPFIKSDFYENENEVRVVLPHNYNSKDGINYLSLTDEKGFHKEKIFFKSISNTIFQHKIVLDIPIPLSLIKSITIGPDSTLTQQDMDEMLFIYGMTNVKVKKSRGQFR